jgi:hypothetical protein
MTKPIAFFLYAMWVVTLNRWPGRWRDAPGVPGWLWLP